MMKVTNIYKHEIWRYSCLKSNSSWMSFWIVLVGQWIRIHENSRSKSICSILRNRVLLQFYVLNSSSHLNDVFSLISNVIMIKSTSFLLKIMKNGENCLSRIKHFTQMVKSEIMFTLDSHRFSSWLISNGYPVCRQILLNALCT